MEAFQTQSHREAKAVAYSMLRSRWGGVCVRRVCQQPFVSSQSRAQQRATGFQRSAQITRPVLHRGRSAAQGAPVELLGLPAQTPPAQPQTENVTRQHAGLLGRRGPTSSGDVCTDVTSR